MKKELYHTYAKDDRHAEVFKSKEGFEVDLYEEKKLLETRQLYNHSESYAEDCADNWVQGVFNIEKEGSFYGYNEKTDNFYPEIDD